MFINASHVIIWPYGLLLIFITAGHPPYGIKQFNFGGAGAEGCRGDFSFEISHDGTKCLMAGPGKVMFEIFFANIFTVTVFAVLFFALTVNYAYRAYAVFKRKSEEKFEHSINDGFDIGASFSLKVLQTTLKLSLTAFVYVFILIPIFVLDFYYLNVGAPENEFVQSFFKIYPVLSTSFIGVVNIVSYGYLSSVFRWELFHLLKRILFGGCCQKKLADNSFNMNTRSSTMGSTTSSNLRDDGIFHQTTFASLLTG